MGDQCPIDSYHLDEEFPLDQLNMI